MNHVKTAGISLGWLCLIFGLNSLLWYGCTSHVKSPFWEVLPNGHINITYEQDGKLHLIQNASKAQVDSILFMQEDTTFRMH